MSPVIFHGIGAAVWGIAALIFLAIGIRSWTRNEPVPPKVHAATAFYIATVTALLAFLTFARAVTL